MRPTFRRPACVPGGLVLAVALGSWLAGLPDSAAQQPLLKQAEQAGAAAVRTVVIGQPGGPPGSPPGGLVGRAEQAGENALHKVSGQPSGPSRPGGLVGRVEQVGENAARKVVGAPPGGPVQPAAPPIPQSSPQPVAQPAVPPSSQPTAQQGGLVGKTAQVGSAAVTKATGGKLSGTTAQRVVTGAKTLTQKAVRSQHGAATPAAASRPAAPSTPARPSAPLPPHPTGPRPPGAPPA